MSASLDPDFSVPVHIIVSREPRCNRGLQSSGFAPVRAPKAAISRRATWPETHLLMSFPSEGHTSPGTPLFLPLILRLALFESPRLDAASGLVGDVWFRVVGRGLDCGLRSGLHSGLHSGLWVVGCGFRASDESAGGDSRRQTKKASKVEGSGIRDRG